MAFSCLVDQDSHLLGCKIEVVTLLIKEEGQGEQGGEGGERRGEEEKDNSREKKRKRADVSYIGFLCLHRRHRHESTIYQKRKLRS